MYTDYFGFRELPFSIAPDPRYLYLSPQHEEALAHLMYGASEQGGFVLLTGEVGTGKTTVVRSLLHRLRSRSDVRLAFVINPRQSVKELLQSICDEFGIEWQAKYRSKDLIDLINQRLLEYHAQGCQSLLIIDEAQNLSIDVLEQLRLLTNLETDSKKLLQLVLVGQPELLSLLDRSELRQLNQRVTARYHLQALSARELPAYLEHRLQVAGGRHFLFTRSALKQIYHYSGGVPRLINVICDRVLLGLYACGKAHASADMVKKAASEVLPKRLHRSAFWSLDGSSAYWLALSVTAVIGIVLLASQRGLI